MTEKTTRDIGNEGEELATAYLESKGYTILERNYHFEHAEVDIVAYDNESYIVFVEVKKRSDNRYGEPEEYIDDAKKKNRSEERRVGKECRIYRVESKIKK